MPSGRRRSGRGEPVAVRSGSGRAAGPSRRCSPATPGALRSPRIFASAPPLGAHLDAAVDAAQDARRRAPPALGGVVGFGHPPTVLPIARARGAAAAQAHPARKFSRSRPRGRGAPPRPSVERARTADVLVVGAGVIGVSIARELRRRHGGRVDGARGRRPRGAARERAQQRGVRHAGVYYAAGSLKARLCVEGNRRMRDYCDARAIPYTARGKVIVIRDESERAGLDELYKRSTANGIRIERIDAKALAAIEPSARTHDTALHVLDTAVVDPRAVMAAMVDDAVREGVTFRYDCRWLGHGGGVARTTQGEVGYGHLVNCAGLHADTVAHAEGVGLAYRLLPFRGGFFELSPASAVRCNGNIYPVPDLRNPFLGVHFTRRPDGVVTVGPTALPLLGREQYEGLRGIRAGDAAWMSRFLAHLFAHNTDHFRALALTEAAKVTRQGFFRAARALVEGLKPEDLLPGR
ncbi:MAG: FAD-dependent oxidoreductase [Tetrasphaera sp.]